jgi:thioredoxin 1
MMNKVIETSSDTFAATVQEMPLTIVDFTADWCPPCRMMQPVYRQMAEKYGDKVAFVSVDTETYPDILIRYGVQSLPTFTFFCEGEPVKRLVGARPSAKFEAEIQAFVEGNWETEK